ncbi:MAG TPA: hypothetical protein VF615_09795 [Longimicrobiaceae bacterium]|jgi:photosystem II stability/assembly factor-like uncharacterized protein
MRYVAAAALALLASAPDATLHAQRGAANGPAGYDTTLLSPFRWRSIGPNRGGRSIAVAGSSKRPLEYYFGATGGGVWKTGDGGVTWRPVSDRHFASSSVGALAVCEANPDVVYAGMGEAQLRGNVMQGDGLYRSADGGKTWSHAGLRETHVIARVRVDPADCDRVYVAALGRTYGPSEERGVFRSTDGGKTWTKTLFRDARTGAVDLALDPSDPKTMYAGLWEVHRTPWSLSSGGPGGGIFKSVDSGETWTELTRNPGLPQGLVGKIGVSVSGADPRRVYAIVEADSGGVFRSDDAGATWTRVNQERKLRQRAFYYTRIYADPKDTAVVYVLNVGFWRSKDGGKTFTAIRTPHGDNHDLWIDPADPKRMIEGNDGGGNVSVNGGESWTDQDYPTAQMYHVVTTKHFPYQVCGAQQDNSTLCLPSDGTGSQYYPVGGGESGYIAPDPRDTDVFYAGSYGGLLTRFDRETGKSRNIQVWPENPMGHSAQDIAERFQWTYPIVFSPHDPRVIYTGSQHLFRTTNEGQSWERISPDLTRADPRTLGPSGGPITLDQTGVETYGTIFTVAPSRHEAGTIWVGSDDGVVSLTRDGGRTWSKVTPTELPEFARISLIDASPHAAGKAYVAANRYQQEDRAPYLFRTEDYGRTWTRITTGIPEGDFLRAVREDPKRAGLLYAGTENGIWVSWNDGASWQSLRQNLPVTQVSDIAVEENDLVIATHGRGFYVLDDIAPLRQLSPRAAGGRVHLFDPVDPVRAVDPGVAVYYRLERPARRVTLEFLDAQGRVVRSFSGSAADSARSGGAGQGGGDDDDDGPAVPAEPKVPTKAGMNRFVWNLRTPGPTAFPGMVLWAAGSNGPRVVPGTYRVRLNVDGARQEQEFAVRKDPRLTAVTQEDLERQFELATRVREATTRANEAVIRIRDIRSQVDDRAKRANDPAVTAAADSLRARLGAVEETIYQVRLQSNQDPLNYPIRLNNKLAALLGVVESAEARPTDQTYAVFDTLSKRLDAELARMDQVVSGDVAAFNELLRARRLPAVDTTRNVEPQPAAAAGASEDDGEEGEQKDW